MATFTVSVVMVCGGQFFFFQEGTVEKALFRNRLFITRQFFRDCLEGVFFFVTSPALLQSRYYRYYIEAGEWIPRPRTLIEPVL